VDRKTDRQTDVLITILRISFRGEVTYGALTVVVEVDSAIRVVKYFAG